MSFFYAFIVAWLAGWLLAERKPAPAAAPPRHEPRETGLDFHVVRIGPAHSSIRWRDGRTEVVSPARLKTLKLTFLWGVDLP